MITKRKSTKIAKCDPGLNAIIEAAARLQPSSASGPQCTAPEGVPPSLVAPDSAVDHMEASDKLCAETKNSGADVAGGDCCPRATISADSEKGPEAEPVTGGAKPSSAVIDALAHDLSELAAAEATQEWALAELKLKAGHRIVKDLGKHGSASLGYGKGVIKELGKRLGTGPTELYRCWNFGSQFSSISSFRQKHPNCGSAWRQVREHLVDPEKVINGILSQAAKLSVIDRQVLVQRLSSHGAGKPTLANTADAEAANA